MKYLENYLENLKKNLNIDLLGVVESKKLDEIKEKIVSNRNLGYYTEFESEDIDSRIDPSIHLENSKSIFVIGMSYIWDENDFGKFLISNHSRGIDYHRVLRKKLEELKLELSKDYSFNSYIQVDSGDLYEKELGRLAGFGYLGKNSLLINKDYGSYIFLGILVTDIDLKKYSTPVEGSCGSCDKCVKSCPSKCILNNYKIDSSICHSYLTQSKFDSLETKNIRYSYGCDICQRVCPKNSSIIINKNEEFRPKIHYFDYNNIKQMSNKGFKKKYKDFSFSWVGRKIILRNMDYIKERG